jgi:putative transposase
VPALPSQLWALDFMSDQLACGRRLRILAIYDVSIRRCLGGGRPDISLSSTA